MSRKHFKKRIRSLFWVVMVVCRWCSDSSSDIGIHCTLWHNPLLSWRAASADPRCGRADGAHVHIHVQLCQGQAWSWKEAVPRMDRLVGHPSRSASDYWSKIGPCYVCHVSFGLIWFFCVCVCVWLSLQGLCLDSNFAVLAGDTRRVLDHQPVHPHRGWAVWAPDCNALHAAGYQGWCLDAALSVSLLFLGLESGVVFFLFFWEEKKNYMW